VVGFCECGNETPGSIKCGNFLSSCEPVSFSRRTLLQGVSEQVNKEVNVNIFVFLVKLMMAYQAEIRC
jgi:hypothetical protein